MSYLNISITLLGGLSMFLFGMKIMSESLQMAAGEKLRNILSKVTNNRVAGVVTGFSVTSIVQSSSATTVMLVSFVSAGLLNLEQSIGIILGANIGTTVTGWIVALFGFKVKIASFALPAITIGFFLRFVNNERAKEIGDVILGFGVLFFGLSIMKGSVVDLKKSAVISEFMATYSADTFFNTIVVVLVGALVTMVIQSSSATMAITMTLCATGLINFPTACALVLGENIGTTITANIASIGASVVAKRSARVHMMFNIFGVFWVLIFFNSLFIPAIDWLVPGSPTTGSETIISGHLAAFHTTFNITNTLIFLPFVKFLAWGATRLVPDKGDQEGLHFKYISTALMSTPAINISQARLEINRMVETVIEMFDLTMNVYRNPEVKMGKIVEEIQRKENTVDMLEKEISDFLVKVSQNNISVEQSKEITSMFHMVNDVERIGDHCERLLKLLRRKYDHKYRFSNEAAESIIEISNKNKEFLTYIKENIIEPKDILSQATIYENRIDELRKEMRKQHVKRLNENKCEVKAGLLFIDMLTSFEKIGDHAYSVAESISNELTY